MYGVIIKVPAPVELYDGMHAEMKRQTGTSIDGCLVHVGRATPDGFEVLEVWESKEHYDRANADIVIPLMRKLAGDHPAPSIEQATEAFEVHGLVIPRGASELAEQRDALCAQSCRQEAAVGTTHPGCGISSPGDYCYCECWNYSFTLVELYSAVCGPRSPSS